MPEPIEINIDASSLSESACILRWHRVVVGGYREKLNGASLVYGSAFHKFIDTMFQTKGNIELANNASLETFNKPKYGTKSEYLLDSGHLFGTCFRYWNDVIKRDTSFDALQFPDGKAATEVTFSIPYYSDDWIKVRLTGTIDTIGKIRGGCYCVRDFKTSSKWDVKAAMNKYALTKQLRFYVMVIKMMAELEPDSILGQIGKTKVGARIDGLFLKPKPCDNLAVSSPVFQYSDEHLAEFRKMLDVQIQRLSFAVRQNYFPQEGIINGTCVGEYLCKFFSTCQAPADLQPMLLERDFAQVKYEPLRFGEV